MVKYAPANAGDLGSIPGSGRPPGVGNGNPLQDACLENPRTQVPGRLQSMGLQRVGHDSMCTLNGGWGTVGGKEYIYSILFRTRNPYFMFSLTL